MDYLRRQTTMSGKLDGTFSSSLLSLQLQVKTLLEGAGGDHALVFLDTLCKLTATEQKLALAVFTRVLERISGKTERFFSENDKQMKELEDALYEDITSSIDDARVNEAPKKPSNELKKFEVLDGGKGRPVVEVKKVDADGRNLIDFQKAKKSRKWRPDPILN